MMTSAFEVLFDLFEKRKALLWTGFAIIFGVSLFIVVTALKPQENIAAMLPDDGSRVARDFQLLQNAPFARKLMISVSAGDTADRARLPTVARSLENRLKREEPFTSVSGGFDPVVGMTIIEQFNKINPALYTRDDLSQIKSMLTDEHIAEQVARNKRKLMSPDGMMSKQQILTDPLGLSGVSMEKMTYIRMLSNIELREGRFISRDGRHALLIAETDIEMTDSRGGRILLDSFTAACKEVLPRGYTADLLGSHRYTVANAELIQRDLSIILTVTTVGILIIFVLYMRCWRAVIVFIFPAVVIVFSLAVTTTVFDTVSGITLGFGAVLMGISVDFALHIYFSIRETGSKRIGLREVLKPGLVCALTTIAAFAVLQLSNLPGQRQLSVFAVTGVIAAVVLAFVVMPHMIPDVKVALKRRGAGMLSAGELLPAKKVMICWVALLAFAFPAALKLTFDGDMRRLNAVPPELKRTETRMAETWGNFRSRAMIFSEGKDLQSALAVNDSVFECLKPRLKPEELLSLSAVLPSAKTQAKRLVEWQAFRTENLNVMTALLKTHGWPAKAVGLARSTVLAAGGQISSTQLREAGLGNMLDSMIVQTSDKTYVITLIPDDPQLASYFEQKHIPTAYFVSQRATGDAIGVAISRDFRRFISFALVAVVLLVLVLYRNIKLVMASLAPVISGIIGLFAVMGTFGISMNIFNVVASILIIGLGVDYGIFMVHKTRMGTGRATTMAVWVSALTTMAGFGALILGRHPALFSIGLTVSVGIIFSILTALFVVPSLVPLDMRADGPKINTDDTDAS